MRTLPPLPLATSTALMAKGGEDADRREWAA